MIEKEEYKLGKGAPFVCLIVLENLEKVPNTTRNTAEPKLTSPDD